ncbi:transposase, partial [Planctomycetota bacterium]
MDDMHLMYALRYVELNPVRAKLIKNPFKYKWSSAAAHLAGEDDKLVKVKPLLKYVSDWKELLASGLSREEAEIIHAHERTGRPLGSERFLKRL